MAYTRKDPDYKAQEFMQWAKSGGQYSDSAIKQAQNDPDTMSRMQEDYYTFYHGESPAQSGFKSWVSSNYPQYFKGNNISGADAGVLGQLKRQYLYGGENPDRIHGARLDPYSRMTGGLGGGIGFEPNKLQKAELKLHQYTQMMGRAVNPAQLAELEAEVEAARLEEEQRISEAAQGFLSQKLLAEHGRKVGRAERVAGQGTSRQRSATRLAT